VTAPKNNKNKKYRRLRLILGDQLNANHSWYKEKNDSVLYVIAELKQETDYVKHHLQKICAFFLAMENFANALKTAKHDVLHLSLDDTKQYKNLQDLIASLVQQYSIEYFEYQRPDEYRLAKQLHEIALPKQVQVQQSESEHFMLPFDELGTYVKAKKHNRLEVFYRKMRKRFDVLMDGDMPLGGQWNFDAENREKLKAKDFALIPEPKTCKNSVVEIKQRLDKHGVSYIGRCEDSIIWPCSRQQSRTLLKHFCEHCLPNFGRFQDAMTAKHPHKWTLFHSRLSFSLNSKMLSAEEVINAALKAFREAKGDITLAQVEGFVRQILGWREYIRAVYWMNMPEYSGCNSLGAGRKLPGYFWHGDTKMACMRQAIGQSLDYAYAHHIQRLMVTGNFCLLTGIDPQQVDAWYLGIYIDAIEWVEMPNTRGMSQFADGGLVATKPYVAGGNYLNKMSDYCKDCHYKIKEKSSENACPFNSLYWHFMEKHREQFSSNPRIGMVYRNWDKQSNENRQAIIERAQWCLDNIEQL